MINIQGVTYMHPNRDLLFDGLDLIINKQDKVALIGNNGAGKSTLLKIIAGMLQPSDGVVKTSSKPYYVPQLFGQFNDYSVARALQIENKLTALQEILDGHVTDENMLLLDDDWAIEERCKEALSYWKLGDLDLTQKMEKLSGGQKMKVLLAGMIIHRPEIVLLDEPTNHLDTVSRIMLRNYIYSTKSTFVIVSHDRALLNQLNKVYQINKQGITVYGGNYDFYAEQKTVESEALILNLKSKEKTLRKAKEKEKETIERQQKLDARGKKKQEKAGLPTIFMNTLKNNAEKSTSRMKDIHAEKLAAISQELSQLRTALPDISKMKMNFDNSGLHKGKILVTAKDVNFGYGNKLLWEQPLNFQITSGERIAVKGLNGSGKTTLIKMILSGLDPCSGTIDRAAVKTIYIDQDYSLVDNGLSIYEQVQQYNSGALEEHEIKIRLNRFLFAKESWDKPCEVLSGGEKMRLMLCSLTVRNDALDIIVLDEPTNNMDLQNIEILTTAINGYKGTLLVVSHDEYFLKQISIERQLEL